MCHNCTDLNREGRECSENLEDCGICLDGYEETGNSIATGSGQACIEKKRKVVPCSDDDDCFNFHKGLNHCRDQRCVTCYDCKNIRRVEKSRCPKTPSDCGSCLPGFYLPHESLTIHCQAQTYAATYISQYRATATATATVVTVVVISIISLAVVIFAALVHVVKKKYLDSVHTRDVESVRVEIGMRKLAPLRRFPSPYLQPVKRSCIEPNQEFSSCEEIRTMVNGNKEFENEAVCFRNPTARYYPSSSYPLIDDEEVEDEDEAGAGDGGGVENPNNQLSEFQSVDDEATLPSTWTPYANNSSPNDTSNHLTNFAGLFPSTNTTEAAAVAPENASSNWEPFLDDDSQMSNTSESNTYDNLTDLIEELDVNFL